MSDVFAQVAVPPVMRNPMVMANPNPNEERRRDHTYVAIGYGEDAKA